MLIAFLQPFSSAYIVLIKYERNNAHVHCGR